MRQEKRYIASFFAVSRDVVVILSVLLAGFFAGFLVGRESAPAAVEAIEQEGGR